MLEARSVSFSYDSKMVLNGISLSLESGQRLGLYGPSGSGKTTLGLLLAGFLQPRSGRVQLNGKPLSEFKPSPVQLIPQHPELAVNPRWRLRDILAEGDPPPTVMEAMQIDASWLGRYPVELSGGELQRVVAARALGFSTRYLIADEISAMLDPLTQAHLWRSLLQETERREIGVLVISHNPTLLQAVCHRVVSLSDLQGK